MLFTHICAYFLLALPTVTLAHNAEEWRSRSIYQLMTDRFALTNGSTDVDCAIGLRPYCGGTWKGIQNKLDYIESLGFDAIWISPVVGNVKGDKVSGQPYHGYWTQDYYSLNQHFGTKEDLHDLIQACHDKDIWVMVDVTVNSMAAQGPPEDIDYSLFKPFNKESDFHQFCWVDYSNDTSVFDCWLGTEDMPLADVNTESDSVKTKTNKWISDMVSEFDFDGLRIDAVKSVPQDFFPDFVSSAGVFSTGEMYTADPRLACQYQKNAMPAILNFPIYYGQTYAFNGTGMDVLVQMAGYMNTNCTDTSVLGTFSENHDLPRFASVNSDQGRGMNMLAFTILWDGIPTLYYGAEQHFMGSEDPYNREALWTSDYDTGNPYFTTVALCNAFRKFAGKQDSKFFTKQSKIIDWSDWQIIFQKGDMLALMGNWGSKMDWNTSVPNSTYSAGTKVVDIFQRENFTVGKDGAIDDISIVKGQPRVFWPADTFDWQLMEANTTEEATPKFSQTTTMTTDYYQPTYTQQHSAAGHVSSSVRLPEVPVGVFYAFTAVFGLLTLGIFL